MTPEGSNVEKGIFRIKEKTAKMKILLLSFILLCTQYSTCGNVKETSAKKEKKTLDPMFSPNSLLNFY
jgi:hypothetical protein